MNPLAPWSRTNNRLANLLSRLGLFRVMHNVSPRYSAANRPKLDPSCDFVLHNTCRRTSPVPPAEFFLRNRLRSSVSTYSGHAGLCVALQHHKTVSGFSCTQHFAEREARRRDAIRRGCSAFELLRAKSLHRRDLDCARLLGKILMTSSMSRRVSPSFRN